MKLPLFVTRRNKYLVGSLGYALGYTCYYLTNHYPIFPTHLLPMSWIDIHTPLVPYTVYIYISEYFYFAFIFILLSSYDNINKYLYAYVTLQLFSCLIFFFYPTVYPRADYPIPTSLPQSLQDTWAWLRTVDAAGNCFPSLHVSSVFLSAFVYWTGNQRKLFWVFLVWATLIALSTLTTKQHYVADILSGFALSLIFYRYFMYHQAYERVHGESDLELERADNSQPQSAP